MTLCERIGLTGVQGAVSHWRDTPPSPRTNQGTDRVCRFHRAGRTGCSERGKDENRVVSNWFYEIDLFPTYCLAGCLVARRTSVTISATCMGPRDGESRS